MFHNTNNNKLLSINSQNSTLELPLNERFRFKHLKPKHTYIRKYSLISLVMIFFIFACFGWIWETFYHYIRYNYFVNRGFLFGPWLPIYGFGGLLALLIPQKVLKNPVNTFVVTALVSAVVEYATSCFFEYYLNTRLWDYHKYIIHLNGRVCLIGTIFFGLGGCLAAYFLGPALDDFIKKFSNKAVLLCSIILILFFSADFVWSIQNLL